MNASFDAFDPKDPPSFESLAAHDVYGSWQKFKSNMHYCGPYLPPCLVCLAGFWMHMPVVLLCHCRSEQAAGRCDLKNAGHCKSGAGALMIALGTYQGVFRTYGSDYKNDPWLNAFVVANGLYGACGDIGDHKGSACGDVGKFSGMMHSLFGNNAHGSTSWDDYFAVKDPITDGDFIKYNDERAPGRFIPYGAPAPYGNGVWTYDYWGKAAAAKSLSGWENLAYLFQVLLVRLPPPPHPAGGPPSCAARGRR